MVEYLPILIYIGVAIVFPIMQAMHIDLQRISLGALIISLSLLVDSAMTAIDVMTTRLAQGDSKEEAASSKVMSTGAAAANSPPAAFDISTIFCPPGPTNKISTSLAYV